MWYHWTQIGRKPTYMGPWQPLGALRILGLSYQGTSMSSTNVHQYLCHNARSTPYLVYIARSFRIT